jgi:hypothetical protein
MTFSPLATLETALPHPPSIPLTSMTPLLLIGCWITATTVDLPAKSESPIATTDAVMSLPPTVIVNSDPIPIGLILLMFFFGDEFLLPNKALSESQEF